jgi:hypothetical protein
MHRIACAIAGSPLAGQKVIPQVLPRAIHQLAHADEPRAALRPFHQLAVHHARLLGLGTPEPQNDVLYLVDGAGDPEFMAFVAAVRRLKMTQREAYILTVGEGWAIRPCAVAMESSNRGVETQLKSAEETLKAATGDRYEDLKLRLAAAYQKLIPAPTDDYLPIIRHITRRAVWPKTLARLRGWAVLGFALLMAAAIWQYYQSLAAFWRHLTGG